MPALPVLGLLLLAPIMTPPAAAGRVAGIDQVSWLAGCWETAAGDRTTEEHWLPPRAGSMLGVSRTVRAGKLASHELVLLREQGAQLAYEAHPAGQPPAVFLSRTITPDSVVFENPKHDFPRRIGYTRQAPDGLLAWIEGPGKAPSATRRVEFAYRRVPCPGEPRR
jgi:hypothetical protein